MWQCSRLSKNYDADWWPQGDAGSTHAQLTRAGAEQARLCLFYLSAALDGIPLHPLSFLPIPSVPLLVSSLNP